MGIVLYSWIITIVMHYQKDNTPQIDLQVQQNLLESQLTSFYKLKKLILKSIWNCMGPEIAKTNLKRKKLEELSLPDFKIYFKSMAIKTY